MDHIINLAADILLGAGAFGAAAYCVVLARRLKRFNNLENGVGGAVAVLSAQVDDMTRTLDQARKAAGHSSATLTALTERAEDAARKLELMMASLHDLPDAPPASAPASAPAAAPTARPENEARTTAAQDVEDRQDADWAEAAAEAAQPLFSTKRTQVSEGAG